MKKGLSKCLTAPLNRRAPTKKHSAANEQKDLALKKKEREKNTNPTHVDTQQVRIRTRRGNVIRTRIEEHTVFLLERGTQHRQLVYLY